jgi:GABA(A) receptor-associated protein
MSLVERQSESNKLRNKFRDRIPVIVNPGNARTPDIDKKKYLVPNDLTFGEFMLIIRKRIKLSEHQALVGFVNGLLPPMRKQMSELYSESSDQDGFLYVAYSLENTFGASLLL